MLSQNAVPVQFDANHQVQTMLVKRSHLLQTFVHPLALSLDYNVFQEYTCERALIFFRHHVRCVWEAYQDSQNLKEAFPFKRFFSEYLQVEDLFDGCEDIPSKVQDMWLIIDSVFKEIEQILPFENLRNDEERAKFITCRSASAAGGKVIVVGMSSDYLVKEY